jgi:hypothetical protein
VRFLKKFSGLLINNAYRIGLPWIRLPSVSVKGCAGALSIRGVLHE